MTSPKCPHCGGELKLNKRSRDYDGEIFYAMYCECRYITPYFPTEAEAVTWASRRHYSEQEIAAALMRINGMGSFPLLDCNQISSLADLLVAALKGE
jgi:hypothetical protein